MKDNVKSALDLHICSRSELHVNKQGKGHVFIYKLDSDMKDEVFDWFVHNVKFLDGYAL